MPIQPPERHKYPLDWRSIRDRILERAAHRCEFAMSDDGSRCDAPDRALVYREYRDPERWTRDGWNHRDRYAVQVVLTVAHLNHDPTDCREENLRAGCQLHHLRHDRDQHRRTAARTRREARRTGELFPSKP